MSTPVAAAAGALKGWRSESPSRHAPHSRLAVPASAATRPRLRGGAPAVPRAEAGPPAQVALAPGLGQLYTPHSRSSRLVVPGRSSGAPLPFTPCKQATAASSYFISNRFGALLILHFCKKKKVFT